MRPTTQVDDINVTPMVDLYLWCCCLIFIIMTTRRGCRARRWIFQASKQPAPGRRRAAPSPWRKVLDLHCRSSLEELARVVTPISAGISDVVARRPPGRRNTRASWMSLAWWAGWVLPRWVSRPGALCFALTASILIPEQQAHRDHSRGSCAGCRRVWLPGTFGWLKLVACWRCAAFTTSPACDHLHHQACRTMKRPGFGRGPAHGGAASEPQADEPPQSLGTSPEGEGPDGAGRAGAGNGLRPGSSGNGSAARSGVGVQAVVVVEARCRRRRGHRGSSDWPRTTAPSSRWRGSTGDRTVDAAITLKCLPAFAHWLHQCDCAGNRATRQRAGLTKPPPASGARARQQHHLVAGSFPHCRKVATILAAIDSQMLAAETTTQPIITSDLSAIAARADQAHSRQQGDILKMPAPG